jgi:DNA-binding transcriptional LysR family regulator
MLTRFTLRQLEYCLAAGEFGSIAKAAEHIHISPSSISAAITQIEKELSTALFIRHHAQGLSATPVGLEVLKQIRYTLDQAQSLYDIASNAQMAVRGVLRVGCFTPLAAMIAPELCQGFAKAHPEAEVSQCEDHHEGLIERLRNAQIDVAITYDLNVAETDIAFEGLAWVRHNKMRNVVEAFMNRCRACISDAYIPGMTAPGMAGRISTPEQ